MTTRERILTLADGGHEPHMIAALLGLTVTDVARTLTVPGFVPPRLPQQIERDWLPLPAPPHGLAADAAHLYYVLHGAPDYVGRVALDGTDDKPHWLASAEIGTIALDATHIYWCSSEPNAIGRAKLDASSIEPEWLPLLQSPQKIALGGGFIYFGLAEAIARVKTTGAGLEEAWHPTLSLTALAADDFFVFWSSGEVPTIGRARVDGSEPMDNWPMPGATQLAVHEDYLYLMHPLHLSASSAIARVATDGTGLDLSWLREVARGYEGETDGPMAVAEHHLYMANTTWLDRVPL